ncbi:hypothetical protein E8L99_17660 [Phreatobacter aquaticus]|uniref:Uncharacterized protein n=1 Tax=Phreatobacter aquaticus TaxID=2570229 RepID=A0A4D7QQA8_9HYPH|nr:hypothetical protein [Phreatobacter aquaticus]QCK87454.1 hypothetical protein E8L99_17660 [Phreatobacter aquaticus]
MSIVCAIAEGMDEERLHEVTDVCRAYNAACARLGIQSIKLADRIEELHNVGVHVRNASQRDPDLDGRKDFVSINRVADALDWSPELMAEVGRSLRDEDDDVFGYLQPLNRDDRRAYRDEQQELALKGHDRKSRTIQLIGARAYESINF